MPLLDHVVHAYRDLAHQCDDIVPDRGFLCTAHYVYQHRTDELARAERRLYLPRPVGQARGIGGSVEKVLVDAVDKGADLRIARSERVDQERI